MTKQGEFFPLPKGEVAAVQPDGTTCVYDDMTSRNSLTDASYVHGGPTACGYGAFRREGMLNYDRDNADVTTATPRRKPDYGL